jgi:hypothetical protein
MKFTLSLFVILFSQLAFAGVEIPNGMTTNDRQEAVRILGFGTSSKILSDPYPLGGFQGFEVGLALENLPAEDLGRLGNTVTNPQKDVTYPKISIGKGLYDNVDAFVNFIPYTQKLDQTQYGAIVRWGFYQAKYLPLTLATALHFNNANLNNQITTRTFGMDIIGGINADSVALYVGIGPIQSRGRFIGGASGVTDTGQLEMETVDGMHTMIGANVRVSSLFIALQIDRYENTTYSGKVGVRF